MIIKINKQCKKDELLLDVGSLLSGIGHISENKSSLIPLITTYYYLHTPNENPARILPVKNKRCRCYQQLIFSTLTLSHMI